MTIQDTTLDVVEFVRRFHGSSLEEFLAANPFPFLLGEPGGASLSTTGFQTLGTSRPVEVDDVVDRPTDEARRPGEALIPERLYPVSKRPGTPFPHMISVGRSTNNDIVLPFAAVSKLHAFFSFVPETDTWTLCDAESSNGTFLGSRRLAANERFPVPENSQVIFGDIALGFVSAKTIHASLGEIARRMIRAGLL